MKELLKILKSMENGKLCLALEGKLDTATAPALEKEVEDSLEGTTELTIDLKKLKYISSAGLRALLSAQKTMSKQGMMKVTHANDMVMEIFEVTGFSEILTIE